MLLGQVLALHGRSVYTTEIAIPSVAAIRIRKKTNHIFAVLFILPPKEDVHLNIIVLFFYVVYKINYFLLCRVLPFSAAAAAAANVDTGGRPNVFAHSFHDTS